jgi:predicted metal-binding protein
MKEISEYCRKRNECKTVSQCVCCNSFTLNFEAITNIKRYKIRKETIILTKETHKWCQRGYKGNEGGCPNYGKKELCPPHSAFLGGFIDLYSQFYLLVCGLDLITYKEIRASRHPQWSERQLEHPYYWQGSIKKILRREILNVLKLNPKKKLYLSGTGSGFSTKELKRFQKKIYSMESLGINVFSTLRLNHIRIEKEPKTNLKMVCLICSNKKLILSPETRATTLLEY